MVLIPEIVDAVAPSRCSAPAASAVAARWRPRWRSAPQGVWCGSVWLTTDEAETHPVVKEKFLAATSADTSARGRSPASPPACCKSAWTDEWERADTPDPLGMPLQPILIAEAQRRIARAAYTQGLGRREARQLLRRPDRRHDEPAQGRRARS